MVPTQLPLQPAKQPSLAAKANIRGSSLVFGCFNYSATVPELLFPFFSYSFWNRCFVSQLSAWHCLWNINDCQQQKQIPFTPSFASSGCPASHSTSVFAPIITKLSPDFPSCNINFYSGSPLHTSRLRGQERSALMAGTCLTCREIAGGWRATLWFSPLGKEQFVHTSPARVGNYLNKQECWAETDGVNRPYWGMRLQFGSFRWCKELPLSIPPMVFQGQKGSFSSAMTMGEDGKCSQRYRKPTLHSSFRGSWFPRWVFQGPFPYSFTCTPTCILLRRPAPPGPGTHLVMQKSFPTPFQCCWKCQEVYSEPNRCSSLLSWENKILELNWFQHFIFV